VNADDGRAGARCPDNPQVADTGRRRYPPHSIARGPLQLAAPSAVIPRQPKEFVMKGHACLAALALAATAAAAFAQGAGSPSSPDPGFVPDTGQINTGEPPRPWSAAASLPQEPQPDQEEARAALMMPDDGQPSAGSAPATTGAGHPATDHGSPSPIGATLQTMPAKFSKRNDLLDRVPVMAWPLRLDERQRKEIYAAVMADGTAPAADVSALKPASALSFAQTRDLHPLPRALADIDALQGLQYVKSRDKVLLVRPPNGIVVDEIAM
jgi:hypothetical protein